MGPRTPASVAIVGGRTKACDNDDGFLSPHFDRGRALTPAMLYDIECWVFKKQHIHKMSVAEMRMLK